MLLVGTPHAYVDFDSSWVFKELLIATTWALSSSYFTLNENTNIIWNHHLQRF